MAWEDTYRDHELWNAVTEALDALAEVPADELTDNLLRLRAVLTDIDAHADQPHAAITTEHLTTVKGTVDAISTALPDSPATIFSPPANKSSPFVQLAQHVRTWPATGSTTLQGLASKAAQVEASFGALNTRLDQRVSDVESQASEQSEEMTAAREQQKTDLSQQRSAFEALIEEKTTALQHEFEELREAANATDASIEQQKTRLDSALSDHQEKFTALQEERSTRWAELLKSNETEFQSHLEVLKGYEEQSQNVLSAVGVNATATDYGAYANEQAKAADKWRRWAIVAFSVAAAAFLVAAIASVLGYGGNAEWWQILFQKLSAPLGASAVGYVLIRESGQHRKEERKSRQVQLTLTALEPFIARLPPDEKKLVRLETARRIFAEQQGEPTKAPVDRTTGDTDTTDS